MLNLAKSKTRAQNRSEVVVHNVDLGQHRAVHRVSALRNNEFYGCALRDCSGPFDIEIGFSFLVYADNAGVRAVHDNRWIVYRQTVLRPETRNIVHIEVASTNDCDGLTAAIESLIP